MFSYNTTFFSIIIHITQHHVTQNFVNIFAKEKTHQTIKIREKGTK
jgi:hypothetical protein